MPRTQLSPRGRRKCSGARRTSKETLDAAVDASEVWPTARSTRDEERRRATREAQRAVQDLETRPPAVLVSSTTREALTASCARSPSRCVARAELARVEMARAGVASIRLEYMSSEDVKSQLIESWADISGRGLRARESPNTGLRRASMDVFYPVTIQRQNRWIKIIITRSVIAPRDVALRQRELSHQTPRGFGSRSRAWFADAASKNVCPYRQELRAAISRRPCRHRAT